MSTESSPTIPGVIGPDAVKGTQVWDAQMALMFQYGSLYYLARSGDAGATWTVGTQVASDGVPAWDAEMETWDASESEAVTLLAAVTAEMAVFHEPAG